MGAAPILTILKDGETVKSISIEGEAVLGRGEGCVIRLEDRAISRQHAVFRKVADGIQLEKKSEFAPVAVNGAECSQALLKEGDVVSIGPYLLKLSVPAAEPAPQTAPQTDFEASPQTAAQEPSTDLLGEPAPPDLDPMATESQVQDLAPIPASDPDPGFGDEADAPASRSDTLQIPDQPEPDGAGASGLIEEDARTKITEPERLSVKLIFEPGQANVTEFEFTQDEISIGRGKNCDIILNDKKASRKNSIIRRAGLSFMIKDLSSANGTWLNGARISEQELTGQDKIKIGDTEFEFQATSADYASAKDDFLPVPPEEAQPELQPVEFDYALPQIDAIISTPDGAQTAQPVQAVGYGQLSAGLPGVAPEAIPGGVPGAMGGIPGIGGIAGIGGNAPPKSLLARLRQLPVRRQIPYLAAIIFVIYWAFFDEEEPAKKPAKVAKKPGVTATTRAKGTSQAGLLSFEALSPEQKKFVEAQHSLAFDYYKNKEYDKALFEIGKIFTLVADYKDSREIERYAKEGKRKMEALEEERRRKEEEARLKARIAQLEDEARTRMSKKQYEQAKELFAQILALDPENQNVENWRNEFEKAEEEKRLAAQQQHVQKEINQQAWSVYREGLALKRKHKYHSAIAVFAKVADIGASDKRVLALARKMIERSHYAIKALRDPFLQEGHEAEAAGEFAKAYQAYLRATKIDPPHPEGYAGMNRVKGVLHDRAKILYTEAVLAESYSDFRAAKKKFKECLDTAPKDDIYYERAQRKLARYFKSTGEEIQ